ncbi:4-hydroxy-tetrahydrodipicolinate synthase [Pseudacidovorax intermedius]|uniref:4-hydroxy-tetrahydrodipicolinate synthase n=1 Tax=Pseudacidovorax intermedius TaxID=433924 RepID=A0A147H9Y0_9BURK|nr:4-hydroxy-tetrahydrodipicolinate synthase [Pseudacidovorax intermedius]KTT26741.1 dihydrodipicolinate synthase [Pseudacidovorax intermedius]
MPSLPSSSVADPTPPDFSGLWVALVTPFRADGAVDHAALAALARRLAAAPIAGFVVCGSTGEAAALDEPEQDAVLATVAEAAPGVRRIMGVSGHHLGRTAARLGSLAGAGLAGVLLPAPVYIRPSQAGLLDWFGQLADRSPAPVLIYDIPYRTGSTLARETLLALAAHPRIAGIKDCGGDADKTRALIADGRLQVLAGEDANIFATVAEGGAGAIAASAHVHTARLARVIALLRDDRLAEARALWQPLLPLMEALFAEPNPGPMKALLAARGEMAAVLRAPMTAASEALCARLQALDAAVDAAG